MATIRKDDNCNSYIITAAASTRFRAGTSTMEAIIKA
jgi:hypothetical protein